MRMSEAADREAADVEDTTDREKLDPTPREPQIIMDRTRLCVVVADHYLQPWLDGNRWQLIADRSRRPGGASDGLWELPSILNFDRFRDSIPTFDHFLPKKTTREITSELF